MTLTPHIVRRTPLSEEDLRSFSLGGETSPLLFEMPAHPRRAGAARGPTEPPRTEPIRPPAPTPTPTPPPGR